MSRPNRADNRVMRICLLMHDRSEHGLAILRALSSRGIRVNGVVTVCDSGPWQKLRRTLRVEGTRGVVRALSGRAIHLGRRATGALPRELAFENVDQWIRGDTTNGPATLAALLQQSVDLLLLGGCGIVGEHVLSAARVGTLNAHPGWLPDYRGVSVVGWALRNGQIPGATIHWVTPQVDGGDILVQRHIRPQAWSSIDHAERDVTLLAATLMADSVVRVLRGDDTRTPQKNLSGRVWPRMTRGQRKAVNDQLKSKVAAAELTAC